MIERTRTTSNGLPVAAEAEGVVLLPGRPARSVVVQMTLAQTTVLRMSLAGDRGWSTGCIPSCQCW